ncbi:MAG TPA: AraC family transcriptional regulator [Candidatus Microbacterium pullistercoris]|nr:AraC family transcriptional regulator [Candidatus Microbacterium pullistercoris]
MDVLADVLRAFRTGQAVAAETVGHRPWGLRFRNPVGVVFHIVLTGSAWLTVDDTAPRELTAGDIVLMPAPRSHNLSDAPGRTTIDFSSDLENHDGPISRAVLPGEGPLSRLICGAYLLDGFGTHPLLRNLPEVIHLNTSHNAAPGLAATIDLLHAEIRDRHPGAEGAVASLIDATLIYLLRAALATGNSGVSTPLSDPQISRALTAIHRDPAHDWTVASLAAHATMSRSTFADRFRALVGEPPGAYVTRWRMTTAARLLREGSDPLVTVAPRVGYASEFAFAKAFKRFHGESPGRYRRARPG